MAVGRSCVGLEAGRAGSWRGRTETAAVPAELCRRRPLLPKDDRDRDEVRDLGPELVSVGISVAAYSGWPRLAQGQEILNKMRALLCSALLLRWWCLLHCSAGEGFQHFEVVAGCGRGRDLLPTYWHQIIFAAFILIFASVLCLKG